MRKLFFLILCCVNYSYALNVPSGYILQETINGDLNHDSLNDKIMLIKRVDKNGIEENQFGQMVDKNRRGLIISFKDKNDYHIMVENKECFSSENEDGGVYYAPELGIEINKGILKINYFHGRYGYWSYTFQFRNNDFFLIGYDHTSTHGPDIFRVVSINYLSQRAYIKSRDENKDQWIKLKSSPLIKLRDIKDFDALDPESLIR